ncbi:MAG: DUF2269 domain-containing protein [Rhodocyclales bacterium]|nr:DUF2269 domain-containing protein [Rhodocyclales bacterium]
MDSYLALKTLHLAGVMIFLGNIIVTGWWKAMADRTRDPRIIAFAQRQVTLTDWLFTAGGVALLAAGGYGNAALHGIPLSTPWVSLGHWLFVASGVIWAVVLIPVQIGQARLARGFAAGGAIPARYWQLGRLWMVFGILATVLPLANLYVMVFKPV